MKQKFLSMCIYFLLASTILFGYVAYDKIYNNENTSLNYSSLSTQTNEPTQAEIERKQANHRLYEKNKEIRNNWDKYISIDKSYQASSLGGIYYGQIQVFNKTPHKLNNVEVTINYIKEYGDCYSTTYLSINNVPPNDSKIVSFPDSPRGTSVEATIISIYSDKLNFQYNPGNWAQGDDPYFTKD